MVYNRLYDQSFCRHDVGFQLRLDCKPIAWVCNRWCGYRMNFDPDKYPDGIALRTEYQVGQDKTLKDPPKIVKS